MFVTAQSSQINFLESHFGIQKVLENTKINLHINPKKGKTKSKT